MALILAITWTTSEFVALKPLNNLKAICMIVQISGSVVCNSLRPHGLQHATLPCLSPTLRAYSNSCPSSQWGHPTISSSVVPFSSHLQSFPESGFFPLSQFFASGGQSIGVSPLCMTNHLNNTIMPLEAGKWGEVSYTWFKKLYPTLSCL